MKKLILLSVFFTLLLSESADDFPEPGTLFGTWEWDSEETGGLRTAE